MLRELSGARGQAGSDDDDDDGAHTRWWSCYCYTVAYLDENADDEAADDTDGA